MYFLIVKPRAQLGSPNSDITNHQLLSLVWHPSLRYALAWNFGITISLTVHSFGYYLWQFFKHKSNQNCVRIRFYLQLYHGLNIIELKSTSIFYNYNPFNGLRCIFWWLYLFKWTIKTKNYLILTTVISWKPHLSLLNERTRFISNIYFNQICNTFDFINII